MFNRKKKEKQEKVFSKAFGIVLTFALAFCTFFVDSNFVYAAESSSLGWAKTVNQNYFEGSSTQKVYRDFAYSDAEQTYTIPTTGMYYLSASGASGANYSGKIFPADSSVTETVTYAGGAGGVVSFSLDLNAGDVLKIRTGKVGGGTLPYGTYSNNGSNGGGATRVYVNDKLVAVAAGGGGASSLGDGYAAISDAVEKPNLGEGTVKGISGGGDGYEVGDSGSFTLHVHDGDTTNGGDCYSDGAIHHHTGSSATGGGCYTKPLYHHHLDANGKAIENSAITTSTTKGGCFTVAYHVHTSSCSRYHTHNGGCYNICTCSAADDPLVGTGSGLCRCGHPQHGTGTCGVRTGLKCGNSPANTYGCGNLPVTGYRIGCGKTTSTIESYALSCGYSEGQALGFVLSCDKVTDLYVPACGGTNYVYDLAKDVVNVSNNSGNGKCYLELVSSNIFTAPYSGDYKLESSDGSAATSVGGAFTGSIHLDKGDRVTTVIGSRGTTYRIVVNDEVILEYHYHKAWGKYHPTTETLKYYYGANAPGGCWTNGSHEHNGGLTCPTHTEHHHNCGGTWRRIRGYHIDQCLWNQCSNYFMQSQCTECHCLAGEYDHGDGEKCSHQHDKGHKDCKQVFDCHNSPLNVWNIGCGKQDTQAVYSSRFYDTSISANYTGSPYAKFSILKIDYTIEVNPNGGFIDISDVPTGHVRTEDNSKVQNIETQTGTVVFLDNPEREGFTFVGWDITGMDSYTHYFAPASSSFKIKSGFESSKNPVYEYTDGGLTTEAMSTSYTLTTKDYKYLMNLVYDNKTVKMKAIWRDDSKSEIDDDWGDVGATMRNRDVDGNGQLVRVSDLLSSNRTGITNTASLVTSNSGSFRNPDSGLALFFSKDNYTITRRLGTVIMKDGVDKWKSLSNVIKSDGKGNAIYTDTVECTYATLHSKYAYSDYILGLHKLTNGKYAKDDPVSTGQYPYVYGVTEDGQKYYPGTWTNKSVVITATAYDGVTGTGTKVTNRNGGTGIYRMKFDDYSRYYDSTTNRGSDEWVLNSKSATTDSTADSSMTIEKTFSASGQYQISILAEDRAGTANNAAGGWIANPNGNNVLNLRYGYSGNSNSLDLSTAILIDKDAPVVLDPENYINESTSANTAVTNVWGKMSYAKAKAMMYEGYNEVVDPSLGESEAYGWSMDYVRVVVYANDGDGSGINAKDASFCWVPNGSGIDYKNPKNWQPADSTRTVNGKVYPVSTRTVSEEESGVVYVRDAVGNYARLSYSVDHMDKEDPMVKPDKDPEPDTTPKPNPKPDPVDPTDPDLPDYTPDPGDKFTWFGSGDMEYDWINHIADIIFDADDLAANSNKRPTSGSGSKTDESHSSSGIWKITIYNSDKDFTTIKDERGRDRSPYYKGGSSYAESLFKTKLNFKVSEEGTNCFIAEILDKAGNLTMVKFVVKIDTTNPLITGNEEQVNLNKFNEDDVESAIQNDDLMSCFFDVVFDDKKSSEDVTDTSGVDYVKIRLVNPEDPDNTIYGENKEFTLYQYGSGTSSLLSFDKTLENSLNFEGVLKNAVGELIDTSVLNGEVTTKLNTFELLPNASTFFWECEVKDRAGNCAFARSNVLPNFSVKAVVHSSEDDEFNVTSDTTINIDNNGDRSITRRQYVYKYTRTVGDLNVFGNTGTDADKTYTTYYRIPDALASAMGLTLVSSPTESSAVGMANSGSYSATNTIPYFQLGDYGYVEVWTVGYVDKIQLDFDVRGTDNIGKEMDAEIADKRVPNKYALGSNDKHRLIVASNADVIATSHGTNASGVAYAHHYGVSEATTYSWLDNGTSIRMPLYYSLTPDGTKKADGSDNYEAELHTTAVYAWKNGWKDTSLAEYVIWDTRADDVHYRITHE